MDHTAADADHRCSTGSVATGFESVRNEFDSLLLADAAYSASLAVYWRGELVVDLTGGADLQSRSVTGVFSATKGVAAVALTTLIGAGEIDLDKTVAHYWPEFACHGKGDLLVRQLLSHQAGLVNVDGGLSQNEIIHSELAAAKLAKQMPLWRPGSCFGYHGLTIGILMEELVRRVTDDTLQHVYETTVRSPRDIDFYLGLPESQEGRFVRLLPMAPTPAQAAELAAGATSPDSLTSLMYNELHKHQPMLSSDVSPNNRVIRAAGPAAVGGIGSALGLARLYASAIGMVGQPLFDRHTIAAVSQQQVWGLDRTLNVQMCFGVVFMKPQPRMDFGSYMAFGHDGAGGALAFADPMYDMAFGYIPQPMAFPGGADPKAVRLAQLVRRIIHALEN